MKAKILVYLGAKYDAKEEGSVNGFLGRRSLSVVRDINSCQSPVRFIRWHDNGSSNNSPIGYGRRERWKKLSIALVRKLLATAHGP